MEIPVIDLGRMGYADAYTAQLEQHERVLGWRDDPGLPMGVILLVEHEPVITLSAKARRGSNLLASEQRLGELGIALEQTDRGGDITYHGPGQLVCYPIVDLQRLDLRVDAYLRAIERAIIGTIGEFGLIGICDPGATGVWIASEGEPGVGGVGGAKIAAIGIRVRRWITLHGLALNVRPNLEHFALIVPCGLAGRAVTSMERELGERCPGVGEVKAAIVRHLGDQLAGSRIRE